MWDFVDVKFVLIASPNHQMWPYFTCKDLPFPILCDQDCLNSW